MPAIAQKKKKDKKKNQNQRPQQPQPGQQQAPQRPKPEAKKPPRDIVDPGVVKDQTTKADDPYAYKKNERGAQLYGPDGIKAGDVRQGAIADCYLAAAMGSVAGAKPDAIRQSIKDNKDGTYTVRFFELDWQGQKTTHLETVDADLAHNGDAPAYARSTEVVDGKQWMELWPSIIEKAYAAWKGSYDAIGHGGVAGDVMTALTGETSRQQSTQGVGDNDPLWTKMKAASDQKKPMTAGSGDKDDPKYKDPKAGVYGWHAYTVLGVEEVKDGDKTKRQVVLRNPWGKRRRDSDAAAVGDTENSTAGGVFKLDWAEFRNLYDNVTING
ncbi:MAG: hypothetical protein FJ100_11325 [Deltaproteobacteria bacterium]|nr:hypothetical protein [Deltaproteobacteria bacterium]